MSSLPVAQYQPAPSFGNEIVPHVNVAPPGAGGLIVFGVFIALLAGVGGYVWTVES